MDSATQQHFTDVISRRLVEIETELQDLEQSTETISPDVSIGRLSRLDAMQHQQIALSEKRRIEEERNRLHEAQRRLIAGTYGNCLLCGGLIATERLEIQPAAVSCVPCAQKR